ncbi:hypothetical protein L7F22_027971 [Adiantum nelumboides]|nr:hypothetical protein [Adiantum nelumboides]
MQRLCVLIPRRRVADLEDCCVFVGGLSWDTSDKRLEQAFRRFGKVLDAKVMVDKDIGRSCGFGFVTFTDEQSMKDAISAGLHNAELDGRITSVSKAQPKVMGSRDFGNEDAYDNGGGRGGYSRDGGADLARHQEKAAPEKARAHAEGLERCTSWTGVDKAASQQASRREVVACWRKAEARAQRNSRSEDERYRSCQLGAKNAGRVSKACGKWPLSLLKEVRLGLHRPASHAPAMKRATHVSLRTWAPPFEQPAGAYVLITRGPGSKHARQEPEMATRR